MSSVLFYILLCFLLVAGINASSNKAYILKHTSKTPTPSAMAHAVQKYRFENTAKAYAHYEREVTTEDEMKLYQYETTDKKIPVVYFAKNSLKKGDKMLLAFENQSDLILREKEGDKNEIKQWRNYPDCDGTPSDIMGEVHQCVDSKEAMINFIYATMKTHKVTLITTQPSTFGMYEVIGEPKPIPGEVMACHKQLFNTTNAVYACHYVPDSLIEVVPFMGLSDRKQINATVVCHLKTTKWNANGFILRLLKMKPGPPVCHFSTTDDMIWVK